MPKTRVTLTYDQWYALFRPHVKLIPNAEMTELVEVVDETAIRTLHVSNKLWTEMDNGDIQSGIHTVNRVRYLATIVPYPKDTKVYVCEEGDTPHQIYFAVERKSLYTQNLHCDADGLPYVFWSIRDGVEWFTDEATEYEEDVQNFEDMWCFVDQEGQRYNWDGTEVDEDE